MKIALLRHGKSDIKTNKILSASSFSEWIQRYNMPGIQTISSPDGTHVKYLKKYHTVVCSSLPRSTDPAKTLGAENIILFRPRFNEACLPAIKGYFTKLKPALWSVIIYILWLYGYTKNSESYKESKQRAQHAAELLIQLAEQYHNRLQFGHEFFNRFLSKELLAAEWHTDNKPGLQYWTYNEYAYNP